MRHRLHQISRICCLAVLSAMLAEWIFAVIKRQSVSAVWILSGFGLAWSLAILHRFTRPRSNVTPRRSGGLRHILHRISFVLCLVCVGMLPVGFIISVTERGELIEHHYGAFFICA